MHKLAKGLKKKKKQKKGKKGEEEEEFDPEELERFRRKRAEAQQKLDEEAAAAESAEAAAEGGEKKPKPELEEWKKFQALTSGIDDILKKTQDDLDRIKSTSFYQRKEKEPEPDPEEDPEVQARKQELAKKYAGFDEHGNPIEINEAEEEEKSKALPLPVSEDGFVEVPDDDDEHEDSAEEDIFDTTYVDVIQNVDVQLAYIPDSPTQEELGDDPFDTSSADKVLKIVDAKTGRKLVSLGNAAEVLAGRVDHVSTCKIGRNRKRQTQDLLLADFEAELPVVQVDEADSEPIEVEKTLLDDDSDLPDVDLPPVDLTKLPPILSRPITPANPEDPLADLSKPLDISEFESFKDKTLLDEIPVLDDEEFDLEAPAEPVALEEADDPFAEKEPEVEAQEEIVEVAFEAATFVNEDDPFDTTIADNLVPGKAELKFIEKELEQVPRSEVSISVTDPGGLRRNYEAELLKGQTQSSLGSAKKDLLGGSATDLSQLADKPIEPVEEITYVDPFDTSSIQELPPGKTELKVLEQELLGQDKPSLDALDDDDFDPRAGEPEAAADKPKPLRPPPISPVTVQPVKVELKEAEFEEQAKTITKGRKPSRPEALEIAPKVVAFELPTPSSKPDLLVVGEEEKALPGKPLTPYYPQKSIEEVLPAEDEVDEVEADPFDTSFVPNTAPGKTELKIIESELLSEDKAEGLTHSVSDHNFDPRGEEVPNKNRRQSDFGPGKPMVKSSEVIESLINKRKALEKRQDSILDTAVEVSAVPLAPNVKPSTIEEEIELAYKDPFDTSHASNTLPGKAELKLLEEELSQVPEPAPIRPHPVIELAAKKLTVEEDPDFDPRAGEPQEKDILCLDTQEDVPADKVLTPIQDADLPSEDIDPFDTSFASIGPGKTELKLLESELISK